MQKSFWEATTLPRFPRRAQEPRSKKSYDVVVIGGGITGLTTAYVLKEAGVRVCLLERGRLGSGDTAHTTAHLNSFVDIRPSELVKAFGVDDAQRVFQAGAAAIDTIERISVRESIACEFRRLSGYLHAPLLQSTVSDLELVRLRQDARQTRDMGFAGAFMERVPGVEKPGVRFDHQALFHPFKYLAGLASAVDGGGSAIFEHSEVTEVETSPLRVKGDGFEIACDFVVVATHVPLAGKTNMVSATLFQTKIAKYSTYVLGAKIPRGTLPEVTASDTSNPYFYWRVDPHQTFDYLILGGCDHKTGQVRDPEERFADLERALARLAPGAAVHKRWSGQVVETHDGLPFIGEINDRPFIATGFTGNGMTFGVASALMARDAYMKSSNPWASLFSPHRVEVHHGGLKDYFKENIDYPVYLLKQWLSPPHVATPESLERGEGAVLKVDGKRVACARDQQGVLHRVSAVCTHMGCLVEWNGAEQTWDCPCHGSRFKPTGQVVAGPAEKPLAPHQEEKPSEQPKKSADRRHARAEASAQHRSR